MRASDSPALRPNGYRLPEHVKVFDLTHPEAEIEQVCSECGVRFWDLLSRCRGVASGGDMFTALCIRCDPEGEAVAPCLSSSTKHNTLIQNDEEIEANYISCLEETIERREREGCRNLLAGTFLVFGVLVFIAVGSCVLIASRFPMVRQFLTAFGLA